MIIINKVEEFKAFLVTKNQENQNAMRDFIKSKYYEFVESIQNINECNIIVKMTENAIGNLDENIHVFIIYKLIQKLFIIFLINKILK